MGNHPRTVAQQCADFAKQLEQLTHQLRETPTRETLRQIEESVWEMADHCNRAQQGQVALRVAEKNERLRQEAQHYLEEMQRSREVHRKALEINDRIREQIANRRGR